MRYVLDTNIVARLLEADPRVVPRVAGLEVDSFGMPLVVFAELLFGVEKSVRREANRARLERFAAGVRVLPFDLPLATRYASVRAVFTGTYTSARIRSHTPADAARGSPHALLGNGQHV